MRFGVQLFGPGKLCRENPEKFFKSLSKARYQLIEPCLWSGERPQGAEGLPVWTMDELASMQPLYEKYHLKILSCHLFADLEDELLPGKILRLCEDFGITQFVIAGHSETTREGCLAYAKKLVQLAGKLADRIGKSRDSLPQRSFFQRHSCSRQPCRFTAKRRRRFSPHRHAVRRQCQPLSYRRAARRRVAALWRGGRGGISLAEQRQGLLPPLQGF